MSRFEAWALPSVRQGDIQSAVESRGLRWDQCAHVAATRSLQQAIACSGRAAAPIEALIDLIVMQVPRGLAPALQLDSFPSQAALDASGPCEYLSQMRSWSRRANGIRTRIGLRFDDQLRRLRRENPMCEGPLRMLVESRREFRLNVKSLIEAGAKPPETELREGISLQEVACAAWASAERAIPELCAVRDDLWDARSDGQIPAELLERVKRAMQQAFPLDDPERERWLVIHHGFHFYTPPQWALFQLLRESGFVDQVFIVHDDGRNPCFEVWRRFFGSGADRWTMPVAELIAPSADATGAAGAFIKAWAGAKVEPSEAGDAIALTRFRNIAEFVRDHRLDFVEGSHDRDRVGDASKRCCGEDPRRPRVFAADPKTLQRHVERLSPLGGGGNPTLSALPIGVFLTRLHECISTGPSGAPEHRLSFEALRDIAATGFLDVDAAPESLVQAIQRSGRFFTGCDRISEWRTRAERLQRLVLDASSILPPRVDGATDRERLEAASRNPLRLAPWADLSAAEAASLLRAIEAIAKALESIGGSALISLEEHQRQVGRYLQQGIEDLAPEDRKAFLDKLDGFRLGLDDEIGADSLIDVIRVLLGREVDFDDADDGVSVAREGGIGPLRSIDALGYRPAAGAVHIANLSDAAFPGFSQPVGWPFRDLVNLGTPSVSCELLETRAANSAPDGLYLIWLALNGAASGQQVRMSWIEELDGDFRNASPLLLSLARIQSGASKAIDARVGGIELSSSRSGPDSTMEGGRPSVPGIESTAQQQADAIRHLPIVIAASAKACPRRFAIQWALGPSGAFTAPHHQLMLCGNIEGAVARRGRTLPAVDRKLLQSLCNDWWRHCSLGERRSSVRHRVVQPEGVTAHSTWVFTLGGSRQARDGISSAYQAAKSGGPAELTWFAAAEASWLPLPTGEERSAICKECPVRGRCLHEEEDLDSAS